MAMIVALYATALLLGSLAFFSFAVAPTVFATQEAATAGRVIRALFRVYYLVIFGLAVTAGLALLLAGQGAPAAVLASVALFAVFARQVLMPRINALRDAELAGDATAGPGFRRLHRLSVWINAAQLVAAAGILSIFVR